MTNRQKSFHRECHYRENAYVSRSVLVSEWGGGIIINVMSLIFDNDATHASDIKALILQNVNPRL